MNSCVVVTPGEPAGIGPDCVLFAAQTTPSLPWCVVASPDCLNARAKQLNVAVTVECVTPHTLPDAAKPGTLYCIPEPLRAPCTPGVLNPANAEYVLACLQTAVTLCQTQTGVALATGPVNKAIINQAGIAFTGHTEWLARATQTPEVVMLLANEHLRVALATTHIPLREVADAITSESLTRTLTIVNDGVTAYYTAGAPRIHVLGLNPHAGENGHCGREEIEVMIPVIERLQAQGMNIHGPLSADTAFNSNASDVIVAMYHDQGLPAVKQVGFGKTVNVTLGLPIVRTSVDHGTASALAGSGRADPSSMLAAITHAHALGERVFA